MKNGAYLLILFLLVILLAASYFLFLKPWQDSAKQTQNFKTIYGWEAFQPNSSTITFNHATQIFTVSFDNKAGSKIEIDSATVEETYANASCEIIIDGETIDNNPAIENNSGFSVEGVCSGKSGKTGEPYKLDMEINYTAMIGFINTDLTERGTIKGEYD